MADESPCENDKIAVYRARVQLRADFREKQSWKKYLVSLAWAFICHFVSFLIGLSAHLLFGMPDWITAAIMFNNTTSDPLLLIKSLDETGILSGLITSDETTRDAIL